MAANGVICMGCKKILKEGFEPYSHDYCEPCGREAEHEAHRFTAQSMETCPLCEGAMKDELHPNHMLKYCTACLTAFGFNANAGDFFDPVYVIEKLLRRIERLEKKTP